MNAFLVVLTVLGASVTLAAAGPARTLVPPAATVSAGATIRIDLVAFNPGAQQIAFEISGTLSGKITDSRGSWPVVLRAAAAAPASIAAESFAHRPYELVLPAGVSGHVTIEITDPGFSDLRAVIDLEAGAPATRDVPSDLLSPTPAVAGLERLMRGRLNVHDSSYFIFGSRAPAAKFQFSFKYRMFSFGPGQSDGRIPITLQFGYTQRTLWDIKADSSPFYDTSYMPEIYLESLRRKPAADPCFTTLGLQSGFRHESNGQAGETSRSMNVVYARSAFLFGAIDGWHMIVGPEVFTYVDVSSENPDIRDYRGNGKLRVAFGGNARPALVFTGIAGKGLRRPTLQFDFTQPIRIGDFKAFLLVQYFDGYGESLRAYNVKSHSVRAGFALVR